MYNSDIYIFGTMQRQHTQTTRILGRVGLSSIGERPVRVADQLNAICTEFAIAITLAGRGETLRVCASNHCVLLVLDLDFLR